MTFIDTNILLYAVCPGSRERAKAEKARDILRRDDLKKFVQPVLGGHSHFSSS